MNDSLPNPFPSAGGPATPARVTVVCMRWGTAFSPDYVKVLYQGVKRNLSREFDFVCLAEDPTPVCAGVRVLPLPAICSPRERWVGSCWPKMTVFQPGLFPPGRPVMFLDLDMLILQPLDPVIEQLEARRGLNMLREWNPGLWQLTPVFLRPDRGGQSSLFAFYPEEQVALYEKFRREDAVGIFSTFNDQQFISAFAHGVHYLPHSWAASFKRHCIPAFPLKLLVNTTRPPRNAKVVVFHGSPKPTDLIRDDDARWGGGRKSGRGPVAWVKEYWQTGVNAPTP